MKNTTLLLCLSLLSCLIKAQSFAPIGAKWYYSSAAYGMAPPYAEYYLYEASKDTAVNGTNCRKIEVHEFKYNGTTQQDKPVYVYDNTDTVFYYNDLHDRFFPLYIFNVNTGDTIHYYLLGNWQGTDSLWTVKVDSVTEFISGSDSLRGLWTHPVDEYYNFWAPYYRKIGSTGMMFPYFYNMILESDGPIRCYSDSSFSYNFSGAPCDSRVISSVSELHNNGLYLEPNPVNEFIVVRTEQPINELAVFDLSGRVMLKTMLPADGKINVSFFPPGAYILQAHRQGLRAATQLFIKQ